MRCWTSRRKVPAADARSSASLMFAAILCRGRYKNQHECEKKSEQRFHFELLNVIIYEVDLCGHFHDPRSGQQIRCDNPNVTLSDQESVSYAGRIGFRYGWKIL